MVDSVCRIACLVCCLGGNSLRTIRIRLVSRTDVPWHVSNEQKHLNRSSSLNLYVEFSTNARVLAKR